MKKNRLLLFAYFYPPLGGPAVQRPLKMVKYLSDLGWDVDVISVKDIVYHSRDESLLAEDKAAAVYRTESADAMATLKKISKKGKFNSRHIYFQTPEFVKKIIRSSFIIDDKYGWLKFALKKARVLCAENNYNAVMATIGPYTSALAAYKTSKEFDLPLIIDYRDQWTLNPFIKYLTPIHKSISAYWERKILKQSTIVTTVGKILAEEIVQKFGSHLEDKIQVMYNGWDQEDFDKISCEEGSDGTFMISYVGGLYGTRTAKYFFEAIEQLRKENKLPSSLQIRFVGNYYKETQDLLNSDRFKDIVRLIPQVDHLKAVKLMCQSDLLLLFCPSDNFRSAVTGKIFEYFRTGRRIFGMVPEDSESAILLHEHGHDNICAMEDVEAIKTQLIKIFSDESEPEKGIVTSSFYSRKDQTTLLADRLKRSLKL